MLQKSTGSPALFLDRDGVIIRDAGYAKSADQVQLLPGVVDLIRRAHQKNFPVVVVTNQSGLGRGWISLSQYQAVSQKMLELLHQQKVSISAIYFAPFYEPEEPGLAELQNASFENHSVPQKGRWSKLWRKPHPGMIFQAARDLNLNLSESVLVGDRATDQVAGALASLKRTFFLKSEIFEDEFRELEIWKSKVSQFLEVDRFQSEWNDYRAELANLDGRRHSEIWNVKAIEDFAEVSWI